MVAQGEDLTRTGSAARAAEENGLAENLQALEATGLHARGGRGEVPDVGEEAATEGQVAPLLWSATLLRNRRK